jgi:hypothetical protein
MHLRRRLRRLRRLTYLRESVSDGAALRSNLSILTDSGSESITSDIVTDETVGC